MKTILILAAIFGLQSCIVKISPFVTKEAEERCKLNEGLERIEYSTADGFSAVCKNGAKFALRTKN